MTSHTGTANVLYDLGFEDAADLTAKVQLAVKINDLIDRRGLTQVETSALTGMSQPGLADPPLQAAEHLAGTAHAGPGFLDQRVEIRVRRARRSDPAGISVVA